MHALCRTSMMPSERTTHQANVFVIGGATLWTAAVAAAFLVDAGSRQLAGALWELDILFPSSAEEGQALAWPAPGWCDPVLRKSPTKRFVPEEFVVRTKRLDHGSRSVPQTTPVPLRDHCRCAAHPLLNSGGESKKHPISNALACWPPNSAENRGSEPCRSSLAGYVSATRILFSFCWSSHGQRSLLAVGFLAPTHDHRKLRGDRGYPTGISRASPWLVRSSPL